MRSLSTKLQRRIGEKMIRRGSSKKTLQGWIREQFGHIETRKIEKPLVSCYSIIFQRANVSKFMAMQSDRNKRDIDRTYHWTHANRITRLVKIWRKSSTQMELEALE